VCIFAGLSAGITAQAAGVDVVAHVKVQVSSPAAGHSHSSESVVLWLTPAGDSSVKLPEVSPKHYQLAQKNKQFQPHLLAVPVGSIVDFPNFDPFFHNVFSLFNGRKFDLGLYESGTSRSVHFDRSGVSYIFCDIHPDMSAVIVSVPTPYIAIAAQDGSAEIHGVELGTYDLHLWAIGSGDNLSSAQVHRVIVGNTAVDLGTFSVQSSPLGPHKNKFGEDYNPPRPQQY
jgi:plastocyanin